MRRIKKVLIATLAATMLVNAPVHFPVSSGVLNAQAAARISKKRAVLVKGQSVTLRILGNTQKVRWSSSRKSVATVSSKGKVIAKGRGTTTITGKVGKKKYTCKITVQIPAISKKAVSLTVGQKTILRMTRTNQKVSWKSSNTKVATIDRYGKITGVKAGSAIISATVLNKRYYCKVTVKEKVDPTKFSETKAKANIARKVLRMKDYTYVLLESSYNCPTGISAKCTFYNDSGDPVDYSTADVSFLEKGHTAVLKFYNPSVDYSTYKIDYTFSEGLEYFYHKSVINGLALSSNFVTTEYGDYIMLAVTNSNNYDCYYGIVPASGSDTFKASVPYDIDYDHYESFISYAYHLGK